MSETNPVTIWAPDTIVQSTRDRLADLIRAAAIDYLNQRPDAGWLGSKWRGKPWMDGIVVDLDERDVLAHIVDFVISRADPHQQSS